MVERAIYEGLILRERRDPKQLSPDGHHPEQRAMSADTAVERERRVARVALTPAARKRSRGDWPRGCPRSGATIGGEADVERFRAERLARSARDGSRTCRTRSTCARPRLPAVTPSNRDDSFTVVFRGRPPADAAESLTRPIQLSGLATHVLECA